MVNNSMPKVDHNFLISAGTTYKIYVSERWHQMIIEYSGLDLSFQSDVLPGISGPTKQMSNAYEGVLGKYLAGLWEQALPLGLLWSRAMADAPVARPHPRTAPIWSWASVGGLVQPRWMKNGSYGDSHQCCSINFLGSEIELIGTDPFGALKSAKLFISGRIIPGKLVHGNSTSKFVPCYIEINSQVYDIHLDYAAAEPGPDFFQVARKWSA
jgi:hypothetical protein